MINGAGGCEVLDRRSEADWAAVVEGAHSSDFYHLPHYHRLAAEDGPVEPLMVVWREAGYTIALPLLLRPVEEESGSPSRRYDATSVYGYGGPIASHPVVPPDVIGHFQSALATALRSRNVVTVFSRLHPLIEQAPLLHGLGEIVPLGETVSIDLTLTCDEQRRAYSRSLRNKLNRLKRSGLVAVHDRGNFIDAFVELYTETMQRVGADESYYWDRSYFERLLETCPEMHLFVCMLDGEVVCGGLYTLFNGIIQAHLGGVRTNWLELSPSKAEIDAVRLWGNEEGARVLHLGGGLGAQSDSLMAFKAAFSDRRHAFKVWRWVVQPRAFEDLCSAYGIETHLSRTKGGFFPPYRAASC